MMAKEHKHFRAGEGIDWCSETESLFLNVAEMREAKRAGWVQLNGVDMTGDEAPIVAIAYRWFRRHHPEKAVRAVIIRGV